MSELVTALDDALGGRGRLNNGRGLNQTMFPPEATTLPLELTQLHNLNAYIVWGGNESDLAASSARVRPLQYICAHALKPL